MKTNLHPKTKQLLIINTKGSMTKIVSSSSTSKLLLNIDQTFHPLWNPENVAFLIGLHLLSKIFP